MARLGSLVDRIRSKNAGPFVVTIDLFCATPQDFVRIRDLLPDATVATIYQVPADSVRRFELPEINVLKFSFPRPVVQGNRMDRDMHAAQYAVLLEEMEIPEDQAEPATGARSEAGDQSGRPTHRA